MGIKHLTKFIKQKAPDGIKQKNLDEYGGNTFAVDTSIFLYKFKYNNKFLESFINFICHFHKKNIGLIFIFDGKPPEEKSTVLENRKLVIKNNKNKIEEKKKELLENAENKEELEKCITKLEKRDINITRQDIINLKHLFDIFCVKYIQAKCEADILCCNLYKQGLVQGCISNDMDFLASGCNILIRDYCFSDTITEYNLEVILDKLEYSMEQFVDLCILFGCDYTTTIKKVGMVRSSEFIKKLKTIEKIIEQYGKKYNVTKEFNYVSARKLLTQNLEIEKNLKDYINKNIKIDNKIFSEENKQFLKENSKINLVKLQKKWDDYFKV